MQITRGGFDAVHECDSTRLPLTAAQSGVWFAQQLDPQNPQFNTAECIELVGYIDHPVLVRSIRTALHETEIAGARFQESIDEGGGEQLLGQPPEDTVVLDVSAEADPWAAAQAWMAADTRRVFDLVTEAPIRTAVITVAPQRALVYIRAHHVALDAFGFGMLTKRIAAQYTAEASDTPAPPARFGAIEAVVDEESEYRASPAFAEDASFWSQYLSHAPEAVSLAPGRSGIAFRAHSHRTVLSAECFAGLKSAASASSVMWTDVLTAAVAAYLHSVTGSTDLTVAYPVMNRLGTAAVDVPITAVNVLPLRLSPHPSLSLRAFAADVRSSAAAFRTRTRYRGEDVARDLRLPSGARGVMGPSVNVKPFGDRLLFGNVRARVHSVARGPLQDFMVTVRPLDDTGELEMWTDGDADAYTVDELEAHAARLAQSVQAFATSVDTVLGAVSPVLPAEFRSLVRPIATPSGVSTRTVVTALMEQAESTPDAPAVSSSTETLTFAELADVVLRIAGAVDAAGVRPGDRVALFVPRTARALASFFGVMATGAAYVSIDPSQPSERIAHILDECAPALVLTTDAYRGVSAGATAPVLDLDDAVMHPRGRVTPIPDNRACAYVIFTSGSTGRPKGVEISHRGLIALYESHRRRVHDRVRDITGRDRLRVGHAWSFAFDASWQPQLWLLGGHCIDVVEEDVYRDTELLAQRAATGRWDFVELSPAQLEQLLDMRVLPDNCLSALGFGGDAASAGLWSRLRTRNQSVGSVAFNFYGPTECTVDASVADVDLSTDPEIGSPVDGSAMYVLGIGLQPVPVGSEGELYVSGPGLAQGYLHDPVRTATHFVADPFSDGGRMYRSGDRARWTARGTVVHGGRVDDQVKIRGFRIELGEVETALASIPGVDAAVATVLGAPGGDPRLIGYVVPTSGADTDSVDIGEVRAELARRVPEYMIPSAVVALSALPLTANGKVDRRSLPAPTFDTATHFRAPRTDIEAYLCREFSSVLDVPTVGVDDDFFVLGGHSLLASRLVARLRSTYGWDGTLRTLFDNPTVAALAPFVTGDKNRAAAPLAVRPRPDVVPLSYAQQRLWFQFKLNGPNPTFNIPLVLRLHGHLDTASLRAALGDVMERHESLRTVFPETNDAPRQHVLDVGSIPLFVESPLPEHTNPGDTARRLGELARHPFDLERERPIRVHVLPGAPDSQDFTILLLVHHIAGDEVSTPILLRDWARAYECRRDGITAIPADTVPDLQYADYSIRQREMLGSADDPASVMSRQLGYWRDRLRGIRAETALPTDRPRPAVPTGNGAVVEIDVAPHVAAAARAASAASGTSPFMFVHAALAWTLARSGEGNDVVLGAPTAGRPAEEFDALVGFFVNTVTLRVDLSGNPTVEELLTRVRDSNLDAYAHQEVPFDRVATAIHPDRHAARHPLFQILLQFRPLPAVAPFAGIVPEISVVDTGAAQFDLTFDVVDRGDAGWAIRVEYATDLYDASTASRFAERFRTVIEGFASSPDVPVEAIEVRTEQERALVARASTGRSPARAAPGTVLDVLIDRVGRTPDALAVVAPDGRLTFADLFARAETLASTLVSAGVKPEVVVAVRLPRTTDLIVGIVAVWMARGAFLVVEPTHPSERTNYLLTDSGAAVLLTTTALAADHGTDLVTVHVDAGPTGRDVTPNGRSRPESAAYVVYTSGSTGKPKGVVVPHRGLTALLATQRASVLAAPEDERARAVLCAYSFAFDSSMEQLISMLGGHTVHLLGEESMADSRAIVEYVRRERIDVVDCVPLLMSALLADGLLDGPEVPSVLAVGGEAVGPDLWTELGRARLPGQNEGVRARNMYGPSECTVDTTIASVSGIRPHLGTPVVGTRLSVLDDRLLPVALAVPGEIYVSGPGVTRGYLGRPGLTAARFVADPWSNGERLYRTGDIARWNVDGTLEYLGRGDNQVKIRGFRVETGEVETVLAAHPGVGDAVVTARTDSRGLTRLVGYVTPRSTPPNVTAPGTDEVMTWLRSRLPDHMVPPVLVVLDSLPVTPNGKIDRAALPDPASSSAPDRRSPASGVETTLCGVFARVLGGIDVGPDDDFFALGGDSIVSIQVVSAARAEGVTITARDVFEQRTVAALAAVASVITRSGGDGPDPGVGDVPLTPIMRDMFDRGGSFGRFAQSRVLIAPVGADASTMNRLWRVMSIRHPMLRARLADDHGSLTVPAADAVGDVVRHIRTASTPTAVDLERCTRQAYDELDPVSGRMIRVVFLDPEDGSAGRLAIVVHHLVVDGVSWRILVSDIAAIWNAITAGETPGASPVGTSFRTWATALIDGVDARAAELPRWLAVAGAENIVRIASRPPSRRDVVSSARTVSITVDADVTLAVLTVVPEHFAATVSDILVTALALAVTAHHGGGGTVRFDVEGHGREESAVAGADLSATIGWFTSLYPVAVDFGGIDPADATPGSPVLTRAVKTVKDARLELPDNGIGYGILRHLHPSASSLLASAPPVDIGFNYLGRMTLGDDTGSAWAAAPESHVLAGSIDDDVPVGHALEVGAVTEDHDGTAVLRAHFGYVESLIPGSVALELSERWTHFLGLLVEHARIGTVGSAGLTPSELTAADMDQDEIEEFELDF